MKPHLFVFGSEAPADKEANDRYGGDQESSSAVWITAATPEAALSRGRTYAEAFVARIYREVGHLPPSWLSDGYAHWISEEPLNEFSGMALDMLPTIEEGSSS